MFQSRTLTKTIPLQSVHIFFKAHLIVKSKTKQTNREIKTNQEEGYHILLTDE